MGIEKEHAKPIEKIATDLLLWKDVFVGIQDIKKKVQIE